MFDAGASKAPSHVKKLREESGMNMEDSASMGGYDSSTLATWLTTLRFPDLGVPQV